MTLFLYVDQCPPEVQANAAETLCAITRNSPSALATKLSSERFVSSSLTCFLYLVVCNF